MIKAKHTRLGVGFFSWYAHFQLKRYFHTIQILSSINNSDKPILLIANHFSWWDGFIQLHLNEKIFQRKFHVLMLEEQLKQNMILNKGGAFSVKKNSKDMLTSLQYCLNLLQNEQHLVLLFPQGEIQSIYTQHFVFEKGLEYLLKRLNNKVQLIFNINLIDYLSEKKPSLNIYVKNYELNNSFDIQTIENDFNMFAQECIHKQLQR